IILSEKGVPLRRRSGVPFERRLTTYPQYLALVALSSKESQTVSELGERLHLESNTLTPLIKRLEAAGLVTRTRDKQDERVVRLGLTSAGSDLAKTALGCVPAEVLKATGMDEAALKTLNSNLAKLGAALRDPAAR
ncbi:MarR family transcriptional regulator, partial [Sphingobium xenophagum]|uniref:MarR family winged helix-turn-helix transcriptional regulator n=2 Tax=Sphingobium TaxID=165695 RepID=UPI000C1FB40F